MKTLNSRPVRIVEFDNKFKIEVEVEIPATSAFFGILKSKSQKRWFPISEKGEPTSWEPFCGSHYHWTKGEPIPLFTSLSDAEEKIKSINRGVVIHEL